MQSSPFSLRKEVWLFQLSVRKVLLTSGLPACLPIGVFSSLEVKEWQNGYQRSLATLVSSDSGVSHFSHLTETGLSFRCISLFQSRGKKKKPHMVARILSWEAQRSSTAFSLAPFCLIWEISYALGLRWFFAISEISLNFYNVFWEKLTNYIKKYNWKANNSWIKEE